MSDVPAPEPPADDKDLTILEVVAKLRALPRVQWTVPDPYADLLADRKEENRDRDGEETAP